MAEVQSTKVFVGLLIRIENYLRSNTAHNIFKLDGEVPKTMMSGETSDISQFCELEWFEWVSFEMKLPNSQMMCWN